MCNLHVVERETIEGPLVETLLLALVQAVHRLQPLDKLLPHPSSTSHLGDKIRVFSKDSLVFLSDADLSEGVSCA